jgi:5-methylcytosine-specific restriction endonuclease McrA
MRLSSGKCAKIYCSTLARSLTIRVVALPCRRNSSTSDDRGSHIWKEHWSQKYKGLEGKVRKRREILGEPAK